MKGMSSKRTREARTSGQAIVVFAPFANVIVDILIGYNLSADRCRSLGASIVTIQCKTFELASMDLTQHVDPRIDPQTFLGFPVTSSSATILPESRLICVKKLKGLVMMRIGPRLCSTK